MTGTIKAQRPDLGYAFIRAEGSADLMAHVSDFLDYDRRTRSSATFTGIRTGTMVVFDSIQTERGLRAVDIQASGN